MNPIAGVAHMLSHPFVQHAFVAGTAIALLSGLVGFFVVLRGQIFAGDALSHVAYTGSLAALALGINVRLGLFITTIAVGMGLALLGGRGSADDVTIGTAFSWILGLGVFFLSYYTTHFSGANGAASVSVLFGSIFGISASSATTSLVIAIGLVLVLVAIARPLLFASLDPDVAAAQGVPVRALAIVFLAVVGASAAEASQAVGALLLVGLLGAPPATARRITARPWIAFVLSGALAVSAMWIGLSLSYAFPRLPASFCIIAVATAQFGLAATCSYVVNRQLRPASRLDPVRA